MTGVASSRSNRLVLESTACRLHNIGVTAVTEIRRAAGKQVRFHSGVRVMAGYAGLLDRRVDMPHGHFHCLIIVAIQADLIF